MSEDNKAELLAENYKTIIDLLGEDVNREGLKETPLRVARALQYLTKGYNENPESILQKALFKEEYSQMVIVKDIDFYSLC